MSRTDDLFALFGKSVSRDPKGRNARLHFFGSVPFDDGTRVNHKDGSRMSTHASHANEHHHNKPLTTLRPTVVALVSINGGVGRSTLATALSSGLQRLGESVVALDLDPQNALRQHFGVDHQLPGVGRGQSAQRAMEDHPAIGFCRLPGDSLWRHRHPAKGKPATLVGPRAEVADPTPVGIGAE